MRNVAIFILLVFVASLPVFGQPKRSGPSVKNDVPQTRAKRPILGDNKTVKPQSDDNALPLPPPPPSRKPKEEDEVITVETNLITTPVSVMDRNGRFIAGLKKKDFKIFENGVQQPITYFQSEEMPFTVILMIDTSPSTKYHIDEIHFAALTFVNQLRPQDQVMVVAFDQRTRVLCEPTTERATLYAAIYKAQFGSGTGLYDAVSAITNLDLVSTPGRKAVILFTDGVDTTSRRADFESTVAGVEEVDALFYTIRYDTQQNKGSNPLAAAVRSGQMSQQVYDSIPRDVLARLSSGNGRQAAEYEKGRVYLETLATNTGGRMFEADTLTNLEASFSGVAEELRRRYSIGYYGSSDNVPGERKQIKIQVARPKAVVRAKNNYVVKKPEPKPETPTSGL